MHAESQQLRLKYDNMLFQVEKSQAWPHAFRDVIKIKVNCISSTGKSIFGMAVWNTFLPATIHYHCYQFTVWPATHLTVLKCNIRSG